MGSQRGGKVARGKGATACQTKAALVASQNYQLNRKSNKRENKKRNLEADEEATSQGT